MADIKKIKEIISAKSTMDGAGVKLNRVFGYYEVPKFDPFLLLDDFGSENPDDYLAGFPWHPHRGIETVTYMIHGLVEHGDSLRNSGTIGSGDIQWMTAGSGIIHQEMPKRVSGKMRGFQLWVNLPATRKMMTPRYRDITKDMIPEIKPDDGVSVKIVSGKINDIQGAVKDLVVDINYFDISLSKNKEFELAIAPEHNAFVYVMNGEINFESDRSALIAAGNVILLGNGDKIALFSGKSEARVLLISGKPINEPVAWRGPIVMNTRQELDIAFREYQNGAFVKK